MRSRRPLSRVVVLSGVLASLASSLLLPLTAQAAGEKTTICHRTSSHTNPYRRITVAQSAVINANGHRRHDGPLWVEGGPRGWGDVIPGAEVGADPSYQENWPAGRTVWDGTVKVGRKAACGYLSATTFVAAERVAGVTPDHIVADLNEQKANEDVALLAALGLRAFTLASLDQLEAVSATTAPVAVREVTTTTAVLRGTVASGPTSAVRSFVWGTDEDLLEGVHLAADQGTGTGTATTSATLRGLQPGTTYSYKAVGTTGVGTDLEGVLEGEVLHFTTPLEDVPLAPQPQAIVLQPLADLVVGTRVALPGATAGSGLEVHTASTTPLVCQLEDGQVVPVAAGTCRITADQPGDAAWEPAPQVQWVVQVTDPAPPTRTRRSQTITFDDPAPRTWRAAPFPVAPASDSGLPVELSSLTTDVCTTDGLQVTVGGVGECRLAADQAGDDDVLPATRAVARFAVTRAPQAVVFGAPEQTAHPVGTVALGATATSGLGVVLTTDPASAAVCVVEGTTLLLRSAGTCAVTAAQAGDARWEAAEPVVRTFTATRPLPPVPPTPPGPEAPVVPLPPVQRVKGKERTETSARLAEHGSERRTAVGGAAATAAPQAERIVGQDRYTTAALVAEAVLPEADGVVMVTGTDFPDGLAGASYAARHEWPMLLVDPRATALTPAQDAYLGRLSGGVREFVAIGGSAALPPAATSLVSRRLDRVPAQ